MGLLAARIELGAFFFLDPPYLGTDQKGYRTADFTGQDAERYIPAGWIVEEAKEAHSIYVGNPSVAQM
ncbi:hypothetical protein KAU45_07950 [bacterium]|nr:hypothetical protein [bacterium]